MNLIQQAKEAISQLMAEAIKQAFATEPNSAEFKFEVPPNPEMGHLAFACFPLAKSLKLAPPKIAADLASKVGTHPFFSKVVAAGPYVNFYLAAQPLADQLLSAALRSDYGNNDSGKGQRLLLEYSSPNTNKPLHLGHGRNNLLGMSLAKLLACSGFEVIKANLVNDRGIHICKSMLAYQKWGQGVTPESTGRKGDKLVGEYYVLYDKKSKEDESLEEQAKEMLRQWERGDLATIALWEKMNSWVLAGFHDTYQRLGCEFDKFYYESETYQGGREIILEAYERGQCQKEENGAISIDLEAEKLGTKILLRGDGTSMYITQDISTTVTKFKDFEPLAGSLFVVGNEQDNHFRVLFQILAKFGYAWANRLEHISYGMITLPEGKMKSREGTVVDLDDLLNELKALAKEEILSRENFDLQDQEQIEFTAEAIGQSALKFFILRSNAQKEIQFNPKESLAFEGATGPYLQYVHARIASLLRKAEAEGIQPATHALGVEASEIELQLLVDLARYPDVLAQAARERNPAVVCNYAYDLCKGFNKFYFEMPILKAQDPERAFRLGLAKAIQAVLAKSLNLLGIVPLERM